MKTNSLILIITGIILFLSAHSQNDPLENYSLVWNDEFDIDGTLDSTKWGYEYGFVRNQELQWYQPQNTYVKDGILTIVGKREEVLNPNFEKNSDDWRMYRQYASYTSACVVTTGIHSWLYGRFEIKARFPAVKGAWPAIWFRGDKTQRPWPLCGEIDLFEYFRIDDVPTILANACWGKEEWDASYTPISHFLEKDIDWENKFHIWVMDWTKDYIRLYLDNELLNEIDLSETINPDGINPFHLPQHLLINLAIGRIGESPENTIFPVFYEIDYVRIYQIPQN